MEDDLKQKLEEAWCLFKEANQKSNLAYFEYQQPVEYAEYRFKVIELISEQLDKLEGEAA